MWPDRVSNPGPLTYESGARPIALRCPATAPEGHQNRDSAIPTELAFSGRGHRITTGYHSSLRSRVSKWLFKTVESPDQHSAQK